MDTIGFIMLRHVNNKEVDKYWKYSYECIRKYYPENYIIIIDDNSDYDLIDLDYERKLYNTKIIRSEYPKRGEILPYYYYYLHNKLFDIAVIIHDSVFINCNIDFSVNKSKFLWHFKIHDFDDVVKETELIKTLTNHKELLEFYHKKYLWNGCFGAMSIIRYDYLKSLNDKYKLENMMPYVRCKTDRMAIERVIACILTLNDFEKESLLGDIGEYCPWGISLNHINNFYYLPIIKIWCGR